MEKDKITDDELRLLRDYVLYSISVCNHLTETYDRVMSILNNYKID